MLGTLVLEYHVKSFLDTDVHTTWASQLIKEANIMYTSGCSEQTRKLNNIGKLHLYCTVQNSIQFRKSLYVIKSLIFRQASTLFRISAHSLEIEPGRYTKPKMSKEDV